MQENPLCARFNKSFKKILFKHFKTKRVRKPLLSLKKSDENNANCENVVYHGVSL